MIRHITRCFKYKVVIQWLEGIKKGVILQVEKYLVLWHINARLLLLVVVVVVLRTFLGVEEPLMWLNNWWWDLITVDKTVQKNGVCYVSITDNGLSVVTSAGNICNGGALRRAFKSPMRYGTRSPYNITRSGCLSLPACSFIYSPSMISILIAVKVKASTKETIASPNPQLRAKYPYNRNLALKRVCLFSEWTRISLNAEGVVSINRRFSGSWSSESDMGNMSSYSLL